MAISVLIVSPTIAFGELIRLTLEGEGEFQATRVSTGCEALAHCQSTPFALAILDSDLNDLPLPDLFAAVQKLRPGIRLIVVPPNSDPKSPVVAGLPSHGYLNKPFYLPELISIVTQVLQRQEQQPVSLSESQPATGELAAPTRPIPQKSPAPAIDGISPKRPASKPLAPTAPDWLQDVARAAQHLTRLSLETAALAALIIRDGKLWAYAGQLSQPAAQELAETVAHYWKRGNGSDLARFIHLDVTDGDYMLYATAVSGDMALAMVFDVEIPFSKIRSQASHLARSLASPPGSIPSQPVENPALQPAPAPTTAGQLEGEEAIDVASLTPLFDDVPPAMPGQLPASSAPGMSRPAAPQSLPSAVKLPAANGLDTLPLPQPPRPETSAPEITSTPLSEEALLDSLEPASPALCNLSYACMMVPRMPNHSIEGDLRERLSGWARQLCLAYGWRLDLLVVSPDHVEWVVNVPPAASPSTIMRLFRQQTSAHIFANFPALARENPSGDFWAPGYLIMSSGQLPPESLVKDFIQRTRRRQGVASLKNLS
jgi:REP element-mobilizing transposase RayT/CheY-like chemotaxis protein